MVMWHHAMSALIDYYFFLKKEKKFKKPALKWSYCSSFLVSSSSFLELQTVTHQERKRELQRNKELREENCRVLRELQFSLMGAKTLVQGPSFIHE